MINLGYVTDGTDWSTNEEGFKKLTHINYAFATVGDLSGNVVENFQRAKNINELKQNMPDLKICLSIGGWGAGNFSEAAESEDNRKRFSSSAIDFLKKYGFDGIDIDWEYPCVPAGGITCHPDDKHNFTLLLKQVREDLDELQKETGQNYLLTIAAGSGMGNSKNCELTEIIKYLDFINVMTYDMGGSFSITGHHTNIYPSKITGQLGGAYAIEQFIQNGVPASKLVYGIAFYGRGGDKVENRDNGLNRRIYGQQGLYFDYDKIVNEFLNDDAFKAYWDEDAQAPYLFNGDTFVTYEDVRSIKAKIKYVKEKNLLGVMFWEYVLDKSGVLLNTIEEELK